MSNYFFKNIAVTTITVIGLFGCSMAPKPITQMERSTQSDNDKKRLFASTITLKNGLTIEKAIAHSLKFNITQQIKRIDVAIADRHKELSDYDQLPSLVANPEYIARDRETKFDQDLRQTTAGLSMAWNVLDFGISYIQARQNRNQLLIAQEKRRAAENKIIKDTKRYFWRSIAAEKLTSRIAPLEKKLDIALKNSRVAEQKRLQPPIQLLDFQKSLLEILNQLKQLQKELSVAKINLAKALNISPTDNFNLVEPVIRYDLESLKLPNVSKLEKYALLNRPELYEKDYQRRIQADETRKALLRFLPGLEFNVAGRYDSGDTYINNTWTEAGLKLTWNIINLFSAPQKMELMHHKEELHELKALALNMTIMTQVHVAYRHFYEAQGNFQIANHLNDVTERIYQHATASRQAANLSELELIRREADSILYLIKRHLAYADLQDAAGELMLSLGARVLPKNYRTLSLSELTEGIGKTQEQWLNKHFDRPVKSGWTITKNNYTNNPNNASIRPKDKTTVKKPSNDWVITKNRVNHEPKIQPKTILESPKHSTKLINNNQIDSSPMKKPIRVWYID